MKRTQNINTSHFRKSLRMAPLAIALSSLLLVGCESEENVTYFQNLAQCEQLTPQNQAQCAEAYQSALVEAEKTAPKYATEAECVAEFGAEQCVTAQPTSTTETAQNTSAQPAQASSGSFWMPLMAGYMMGNIMNGSRANAQPMFSSKNPASPMYGKFVDASGKSHGAATAFRSASVPKSDLAPKPAQTSTVSRGGFGQQVMAKNAAASSTSSKSTIRSSSSRSFGG